MNIRIQLIIMSLFVVKIETDRDEIVFQDNEFCVVGSLAQHLFDYDILWKCYSKNLDEYIFGLTCHPNKLKEFTKACRDDKIYVTILDAVKIC